MSASTTAHLPQLIPVKTAADLVPYSRDYITRLARDGRVIAVQIDRQWFVDRTSLLNFQTHSEIEDAVRSRRLSQLRKSELEMRELRRVRLETLSQKISTRRHSLVQTMLILVCGVGTGVLMLSAAGVMNQSADSVLALVFKNTWSASAPLVGGVTFEATKLAESGVSEQTESLPLAGGIVLLPASAASATAATHFFSDEVTVLMVSPTTGVIRNDHTEMSFVQVPDSATATVSSDSQSPHDVP